MKVDTMNGQKVPNDELEECKQCPAREYCSEYEDCKQG